MFVRSTGVFSPVPPHSLKEAAKDHFKQNFAPAGCSVHHQGTYHQLVRNGSGVHIENAQLVDVYTQEELGKMSPAQRLKCEWRGISVLDCVQIDASSPGTPHVPFRLITCHVTAGGKYSNIDDPEDPSKTANHTYDRALHSYPHALKCVQLAEEVGHNNVIIGGNSNEKVVKHCGYMFARACRELRCKKYLFHGTANGCIVAFPERLAAASNFNPFHHTRFPLVDGGLEEAFYIRVAWEM